MNIKGLLQNLCHYYMGSCCVGHTHAALYGVLNNEKAKIIVESRTHGELLKLEKEKYIPLNNFLDDSIRGLRDPIVFDNFTLHCIFREALMLIQKLEEKLARQKEGGNEQVDISERSATRGR